MTEAARVWFILQYFGLPAAVLNGGLPSLVQVPEQPPAARPPLHLNPGSGRVGLMSRERLKQNLSRVQIFDARTAAEFAGADLKGNTRGGHLPGATLVPHESLLDGRHLKTAEEISRLLGQAGIDGSKPIISHCNGGGRAALAALAADIAGKADVEVYYLSFADWAADESCPVQQPG
jgi:thiosulfate/3-mercaptopyruvate sulfurtransferase